MAQGLNFDATYRFSAVAHANWGRVLVVLDLVRLVVLAIVLDGHRTQCHHALV